MHLVMILYMAILFFLLTPTILVSLPPKSDNYTVAGFHAVVFALVFQFTHSFVLKLAKGLEGFQESLDTCGNNGQTGSCSDGKFCRPVVDSNPLSFICQ
jgi:hypothetical protein